MIDLHSHTDQSDGTFTATELVNEAMRIHLKALAITDHDTMSGYYQAVPFAAAAGLKLICGIELSTKYQGVSVHLLGYFPAQPPTQDFREWLAFLMESRRDRNRRLIQKLESLGIPITLEEVEAYGKTLTARPHFARVLIDKGYAKDMQDAFDQYLDESGKGYVQRHDIPIQEAIDRIKKSGGVSSLAHPVRVAKNNWIRWLVMRKSFRIWAWTPLRCITATTVPRMCRTTSRSPNASVWYYRRIGFPRRQQAADLARYRLP